MNHLGIKPSLPSPPPPILAEPSWEEIKTTAETLHAMLISLWQNMQQEALTALIGVMRDAGQVTRQKLKAILCPDEIPIHTLLCQPNLDVKYLLLKLLLECEYMPTKATKVLLQPLCHSLDDRVASKAQILIRRSA